MKLIFGFLIITTIASAGELKYPVSEIPGDLKEGVNAVVREDHTSFTIISKSKASLTAHYVVTIFSDAGKDFASQTLGYDKLSKITAFKGTVYDAQGKVTKKLKGSEIYDQSAYDGFSLYSDNRLKHADLSLGSYPYTVEFDYEIEYKYLFIIPGSTAIPRERVAVQNFSYALNYPSGLKPRYKSFNISESPKIEKLTNGTESVKWTLRNIKPITLEPYGPLMQDLAPQIIAAPSLFEYEGYSGQMNSWDELGQWITSLNRGRNELPTGTKEEIATLTQDIVTTEEKVKVLYEYLQNKTRYVSIQLGIGGFQPFEADVVDQTGYGDCKALSNYMVSLLDAAGIKSYYTLVRAGEDASKLRRDFPSSQFNHVIVNVPNGADTLWLECTSQTNPFGYMGTFTGNRQALAITEGGARIVNTPMYTADHNVQSRSVNVIVQENGDARANVTTTYSGLQYENNNLNFILSDQKDKQEKWVQRNTGIPAFDINSFSIRNNKQKIPSAVVNLDLSLRRYASVSGKRLFLTPNLMNRRSYVPEKIENRKTDVIQTMAYTDFDTIHYQVPDGLYPEFLPEPTRLESRFGEYETSIRMDETGILYFRKIKMLSGEFPPESYNELVEFYKNVSKADNVKIVFLNKT
jgi:hypothetical protein